MYKSIIKKIKTKHDKIVLLVKTKSSSIEVIIPKAALIDSSQTLVKNGPRHMVIWNKKLWVKTKILIYLWNNVIKIH